MLRSCAAITYAMDTLILPNEPLLDEVTSILDEGRHVTISTSGNSMLPFIHGGRDSVELVRDGVVNVNDAVLAKIDNGRYVLHRIIRIDGDDVTLMGDGNVRGTEHCRIGNISGRVLFIVRKNGKRIDCSAPAFARKVRIWRRLLPLRRYLLAVYRRLI